MRFEHADGMSEMKGHERVRERSKKSQRCSAVASFPASQSHHAAEQVSRLLHLIPGTVHVYALTRPGERTTGNS